MSSKADDFDVRYRDGRDGRAGGDGADGGYVGDDHGVFGGTVDYDLGYDDNGWDTQGFRRPEGGYSDHHETTQLGSGAGTTAAPRQENGRGGSHARTASTQQVGPLTWTPDAPGSTGPWLPVPPGSPVPPGRRGRRARSGGPGGPQGPRPPKVKGSWWRHWTWRKALGLLLSVIGGIIVLLVAGVAYIYSKTPVPAEQMALSMSAQSVVYASDGHTIIGRFGSTDRQVVTYQQIPAQIIDSVLSAEDRNFFSEGGISPTSILRAAWEDTLGGGNLQGGSTITQQFVRNFYQGIGTSQTVSRKVKEIFIAMKISRQKSKDWILENYLNTIYLGQGAYGIGAATQTYFNIPVSRLSTVSWSQAALLAAIIQQPSTYPLPQYRNDLEARWQYVRTGLLKMGSITPQQYDQMKFPAFGDYAPGSYGNDVWDPYVMNVVKNEMTGVYGYSEAQLLNGGYKIVTTIDPAKMSALYQAVITEKQQMAAGGEALQSYMHIGAVLENPQTGAIEAFYGGPGYPGYKYDGDGHRITVKECNVIHCEVNMAIYAREQVGSSFKPYVLSAAVAAGMNAKTSLLDGQDFVCIPPDSEPKTFPTPEPAPSAPNGGCTGSGFGMSNDSTGENGAFNPQDAMTNSVNTAYADLWHYVGGQAVVHMAAMFGVRTDISGLDHDGARGGHRPRPSLAQRARAGHDAVSDRQRRHVSRRARDRIHLPGWRALSVECRQPPGVQPGPEREHEHGVAGPVRDVKGRVRRHRRRGRDERRPPDHRQDRDHEHGSVGVLHRRDPAGVAGDRHLHQPPVRPGQRPADPERPGRHLPGLWWHLAGHDLAHLRGEHVPPAGR